MQRNCLAMLLAILGLLASLSAATSDAPAAPEAASVPDSAGLTDWAFDGFIELLEVPEPSGLCYCPPRDTLFIVDDGAFEMDGTVIRAAGVYELDLHGAVLAKREIGIDLEGICWCSEDGYLYVCDEANERVYILEPEGLTDIGSFQVARSYAGSELLIAGGNGFEGIEFIPASAGQPGYFLLLNQDDPHALIRIELADTRRSAVTGPVPITTYWPLPAINLGELHYDGAAQELWVVHSWMNVTEIIDINTMELRRWEICPGAAQEAVAVDGSGRLWIGYDLGGLSRYVRGPAI